MIAVIDYGVGNIGSILNMLAQIGAVAEATADPAIIERAEKLILPGVGTFDAGMGNLRQNGLIPTIEDKVHRQKAPVLGICLGMQLMMERSEEGSQPGLGWLKGEVVRFKFSGNSGLRVPHMGWNTAQARPQGDLFRGIAPAQGRFYFLHSYYCVPALDTDVLATCNYGLEFACALRRSNVMGVQFHPEKSHHFGMQLLENFARM